MLVGVMLNQEERHTEIDRFRDIMQVLGTSDSTSVQSKVRNSKTNRLPTSNA